jgi:hypothetical protein
MTERSELQAKVFVNTRNVHGLAEHLAARLRRPLLPWRRRFSIATPVLDREVEENDDRSEVPSFVSPGDGFLYFPTLVSVFAGEPEADPAVILAVADVLALIDELRLEYVTASDFEDELPNVGRSTPE